MRTVSSPAKIAFAGVLSLPLFLRLIAPEQCSYLLYVGTFCGIYAILTVGLDLLMGYTGQISVGHAAFFGLGAYMSAILTTKAGLCPTVSAALGMACSGAVAWCIGRAVLSLKGYYLAMATLAFNEILINLIIGLESITGGASGIRDIPRMGLLGFTVETQEAYYVLVWAVTIAVIVLARNIASSAAGRALLAIHSDEVAASACGIDVTRFKTAVFVVANVFASLAGSLYAHAVGFIAPDDFSLVTSVNLIVMLYLGGIGTIYGAVIGAVFLKVLPEVTCYFLDYELLVNGLILVLVLLFMPEGVFGLAVKMLRGTKNGAKGV